MSSQLPERFILTSFTFRIVTNKILTGATVLKILYTKPDGTEGFWVPTVECLRTIYFKTAPADIDQPDEWMFQPYAEVAGDVWKGDKLYITFSV